MLKSCIVSNVPMVKYRGCFLAEFTRRLHPMIGNTASLDFLFARTTSKMFSCNSQSICRKVLFRAHLSVCVQDKWECLMYSLCRSTPLHSYASNIFFRCVTEEEYGACSIYYARRDGGEHRHSDSGFSPKLGHCPPLHHSGCGLTALYLWLHGQDSEDVRKRRLRERKG